MMIQEDTTTDLIQETTLEESALSEEVEAPNSREQDAGRLPMNTFMSRPRGAFPPPGRPLSPRLGNPQSADSQNVSLVVEAVSQVKEGILKDLSRLLDDKLAGLDEVVVELIRCKSENDTLKQKLKTSQDEAYSLRQEVSRFKPVQFGFYRKIQ